MVSRPWVIFLLLPLLGLRGVAADDAPVAVGAAFETFIVGTTTYRQVRVMSVNPRTLVIRHTGGMASIRLRDLAPEWQARFGYDPKVEAAAESAEREAPKRVSPAPRPAPKKAVSKFDTLLQQFGQAAEIRPEVDLRQKFLQLELSVKSQGRRPSCAIFAVVSALEFQHAELTGKAEKFSEEYLIWAVRQSIRRLPADDAAGGEIEDQDAGFTLAEVVTALRAYGIPLQASMPNTFGSRMAAIEDPAAAIIDDARNHQRVFVHALPARGPVSLLNNAVHALNAGPCPWAWPGRTTGRCARATSAARSRCPARGMP
jgi:hypothetical protein